MTNATNTEASTAAAERFATQFGPVFAPIIEGNAEILAGLEAILEEIAPAMAKAEKLAKRFHQLNDRRHEICDGLGDDFSEAVMALTGFHEVCDLLEWLNQDIG